MDIIIKNAEDKKLFFTYLRKELEKRWELYYPGISKHYAVNNNVSKTQYMMMDLIRENIPGVNQLTPDDLIYICHTAVLEYWSLWLMSDKNQQKTIRQFVSEKYASELLGTKADEEMIRPWLRTAEKYLFVSKWEQRNIQKQRENLKIKRGEYSCIFLRFLELYRTPSGPNHPGSLEKMVHLLYDTKRFFAVTANKKSTNDLEEAYFELDKVLQNISEIKNNREYVIACMQIRDFEAYNRCILMANLANYMDSKCMSTQNGIPELIKAYSFCMDFSEKEEGSLGGAYISPFVMYSDTYVKQAYKPKANVSLADHVLYMTRARYIAARALVMYLNCFPVEEQPSWTDDDFDAAAQFLKNDYKIEELLKPLNLKKSKGATRNVYDYIRYLYKDRRNNIEQRGTLFRELRKEEEERKKERKKHQKESSVNRSRKKKRDSENPLE